MLLKIVFFSILLYLAIRAGLNLLAAVAKDGRSPAGHIDAFKTFGNETFRSYPTSPRSYAPRPSSAMNEDIEDAKWKDVT